MTSDEIKQKLIDNGLENYIPLFEEHHLLDISALSTMTNEDYLSIGVTIIGDRKKLLSLFEKKEEPKPQPKIEVKVDPNANKEPQNIVIEKKSSGVWVFIGVLIAIILVIIIIASL